VTRAEALRDEDRRVRRVRVIVNVASTLITQGNLTRPEGEAIVANARARILELFPGREETYDLLYGRRFARLLESLPPERPDAGGVLVPFPNRWNDD
jgi:hypothetical protein